jgi:hypothetical protein
MADSRPSVVIGRPLKRFKRFKGFERFEGFERFRCTGGGRERGLRRSSASA